MPQPPPTPAAVPRPCGDTEGRGHEKMESVCRVLWTLSSTDHYALIKAREAEVKACSLRGSAAWKGSRQGRSHIHGHLEAETQGAISTAALGVGVGSAQPHKTCFQQHISERKGQQDTDLMPAVALNREVQRGFHRAWSLFYHSNSMATLGTGDID